jgi:hypothetical protein
MEDLLQPEFVRVYGPALTYLALAAGLWLAITAAYLPGTGVPELGAFLALGFAAIGLLTFPVNLLGLVLMITGTALFMALLYYRTTGGCPSRDHPPACGVCAPLWSDCACHSAGACYSAAGTAYHQTLLMPGLREFQDRPSKRPDTLIGALGSGQHARPGGHGAPPGHDLSARRGAIGWRRVRVVGRRG